MKDLLKKFKFKGDGVVFNSPSEILSDLLNLGMSAPLDKKTKTKNTLVFINDKKEFLVFLNKQLKYIEHDSVLWIAYPKQSSGIKSDINRDIIAFTAEDFGITSVAAISINETWSGLRFRPIECVGKK
jgi:hypothetical protein